MLWARGAEATTVLHFLSDETNTYLQQYELKPYHIEEHILSSMQSLNQA